MARSPVALPSDSGLPLYESPEVEDLEAALRPAWVDVDLSSLEHNLAAIRGLGLTSAQCLAVEDSPSGTQAAVAAGVGVLVVSAGVDVPEGPGRIFASTLLGATVDELRHLHDEFRRSSHRVDAS